MNDMAMQAEVTVAVGKKSPCMLSRARGLVLGGWEAGTCQLITCYTLGELNN